MPIKVLAGIIEKEGKFLIGRRAPGKVLEGKWEFPGGRLKKLEFRKRCLKREFKEEFEVKIKVGEYLGENIHNGIRLICYYAEHISGDFKLKDHDEIAWVHPYDFKKYDFAEADIPLAEKVRDNYHFNFTAVP